MNEEMGSLFFELFLIIITIIVVVLFILERIKQYKEYKRELFQMEIRHILEKKYLDLYIKDVRNYIGEKWSDYD